MSADKEKSNLLPGSQSPPTAAKVKDPTTLEDSHEDKAVQNGCCGVRRLRLVEPVFTLFEFAVWSMIPLSEQFVYNRLTIEANISHFQAQSTSVVGVLLGAATQGASSTIKPQGGGYHGNGTEALLAAQQLAIEHIQDAIKGRTSQWVLYLNLGTCIPAIFSTLLLCAYGDIGGRKPGVLIPCIGGGLKVAVYMVVDWFNLPLGYLVVAHVVEGLSGGQLTMTGSTYAYLADVVPSAKRTLRYTVLNTFLLLSCTVGNLVTGFLINYLGYLGALCFPLTMFGLGLLYGICVMAESREKDRERRFSVIEVATTTLATFKLYVRPREGHKVRTRLALLLTTMVVNALIVFGLIDVQILYLLGDPFYFTSILIGVFLAVATLCNGLGPLVAIGLVGRVFAVSDAVLGMASAVSGTAGYILLALAKNTVQVFMVPIVANMIAAGSPISRAAMSKIVDEKEQGALQASISCINVFSNFLGVTYHVALYTATVDIFPGLVFLVVAAMFAVSFTLYAVLYCFHPRNKEVTPLLDSPLTQENNRPTAINKGFSPDDPSGEKSFETSGTFTGEP